MLALPETLKLEQDISNYTYLNQEMSRVGGMDDASNFRAVQVGTQCGAGVDPEAIP
jgi:hypothetical protein